MVRNDGSAVMKVTTQNKVICLLESHPDGTLQFIEDFEAELASDSSEPSPSHPRTVSVL